jgi:copper oxidase (laccase) domain-containing protein
MLDLAKVNIAQLKEVGVLEKNIEDSYICTCCEYNNYFSYRKTACSGRFLSAIGLK